MSDEPLGQGAEGEPSSAFRSESTSDERARDALHTIDPGFVHHRAIESFIGPKAMQVVDRLISDLPDLPAWRREARIDHIYTRVLLDFTSHLGVNTLGGLLAEQRGRVFVSTETVLPIEDLYEVDRAVGHCRPKGNSEIGVEIHFTTSRISGDTLRSSLHQGGEIALVATLHGKAGNRLIFHPLLMGFPLLRSEDPDWDAELLWLGRNFYEHFPEDFDEFSKITQVAPPETLEPMRHVSEAAFKTCLASLVGADPQKDWGGEASDLVSSHLHLKGKRVSAAFLLKGPSNFRPMGLDHLGKRNDQIYRLAGEPSDVLVVQHSHEIQSAVRATLRAFVVQPGNPRRYVLMDGRDSLRLLIAYNLYDRAVELTAQLKTSA